MLPRIPSTVLRTWTLLSALVSALKPVLIRRIIVPLLVLHITLIDCSEDRAPRGVEHFDSDGFAKPQERGLRTALIEGLDGASFGDAGRTRAARGIGHRTGANDGARTQTA